jgi:CHASE2 domain-containing sensor protein
MNKWAVYNAFALTVYFVVSFFVSINVNANLSERSMFFALFASWLILMLGIQIVHLAFKRGQFINRFLSATVFQILGFLGLCIYLLYNGFTPLRPILLSLVIVHMGALLIQTIFFLRFAKTTE